MDKQSSCCGSHSTVTYSQQGVAIALSHTHNRVAVQSLFTSAVISGLVKEAGSLGCTCDSNYVTQTSCRGGGGGGTRSVRTWYN